MKAVARRGALGALLVCAALVAPAQATVRQGSGTDPAGDSTSSAADIVEAAALSDDAGGRVAVALRFAATPLQSAYYAAVVGTSSGTDCVAPYVVFAGNPASGIANYARDNNGPTQSGQIAVDGTVVTLSAVDAGQLSVPFDCLYGAVKTSGSATAPFVDDTSIITLTAPAPPAATPTPTPTPAAPAPAPPAPTVATTPPVPVPKEAKLTVSLDGAPTTIKRNKSMTLKLKIANDGSKNSSRITVSFGKARGLSGVSKPKKLSAFKPAQKRTYKLKVKLTRSAKISTTLKVTVKAGKQKASSALVLRIGKAKKAVPQPEAKKSPIVGTFWWRNVNHVDYAWDNRALYFVDGGTVYSGFPKGGLPSTCTTPAAEPDDEVDTREGCLAYTFDEKSGAVTIGDKAGTFKDGTLTIDGNAYTPLFTPQAGKR